jgi:hypothetical protein
MSLDLPLLLDTAEYECMCCLELLPTPGLTLTTPQDILDERVSIVAEE